MKPLSWPSLNFIMILIIKCFMVLLLLDWCHGPIGKILTVIKNALSLMDTGKAISKKPEG